jgi:hypothetical protein
MLTQQLTTSAGSASCRLDTCPFSRSTCHMSCTASIWGPLEFFGPQEKLNNYSSIILFGHKICKSRAFVAHALCHFGSLQYEKMFFVFCFYSFTYGQSKCMRLLGVCRRPSFLTQNCPGLSNSFSHPNPLISLLSFFPPPSFLSLVIPPSSSFLLSVIGLRSLFV